MHFTTILLPLLPLLHLTTAQYFSAGWQPGQPVHDVQDQPAPAYTPGAETEHAAAQPKSFAELFSVNTLLTSPPVVSLFERLGINITERIALTKATLWDERIPLITDDNYNDLVVNEPLTEQEERDRVWITVITVTASKQEGISKYLDQVFDSAYNETIYANDLPNVRWGRIDYMNVTHITTKWNVWQGPFLVVITNRGQDLRFYKPHQLRLKDYALREFLLTEGWRGTSVWESRYGPGGDREWILDLVATCATKFYDTIILIPRWLLFIITGGVASILINFLHRPSKKQPVRESTRRQANPTSGTQTLATKPSASDPARTQVKVESTDENPTPATNTPQKRSTRKTRGKKQQA